MPNDFLNVFCYLLFSSFCLCAPKRVSLVEISIKIYFVLGKAYGNVDATYT